MMKVECRKLRVEGQKPVAALRSRSDSRLSTLDSRRCRRGMTLIELLVVVVIITTMVAAAIPLLSPSNDDRRLREAARGVNTFISGAQSRAISRHRPYGVAIKRISQDTNTNNNKLDDRAMSVELFYVEQPAPYTGFDANSRACVALNPNTAGTVLIRFITRGGPLAGLPMGWGVDLFPDGVIRPGDVIEVNGTQFELLAPYNGVAIDATTGCFKQNGNQVVILVARPSNDSGQQINPRYDNSGAEIGTVSPSQPPYWASPAPYKILRQPAPTSDQPYQMPEGTAIDLRASGVGRDNFFYVQGVNDNDQGILIMFAPEGRVSRVSYSQLPSSSTPFDQPVVDNVYLLVGRRDRVPPALGSDSTLNKALVDAAVTEDQRIKLRDPINWLNGSSRWIAIGSQSGHISTIENGVANLPVISAAPGATETERNEQIYAAREFTKEMGRLGGR
jgi:prepilin-type N-terminal cleavage/methylation domain-containing protein